ncbi:hypothetical protein FC83_GL001514 [Agrilactobacillus composti DSM 18527 = JCM 14202]|uniref:Uncharacterized protein n=1 Tax=Agrilactobacillus composti DSM 18527 = JCM 14202 TaxID=1423734 RepID=X0PPB8_9LACO|nr:hypothetical protein [Agrilactobacillus composti]KRM30383.1 hypothetical protein FC83_GL001514 [Agrilactobacillus composti DSM 18527 = JCM 14202]GAF38851.1 hypothetical protein JCM14202_682 [Agrilactobacillus composti DSM 18527 = JCM 14202]
MINQDNQVKLDKLVALFHQEIKVIFAADDRLAKYDKLPRKVRRRVYNQHFNYALHWDQRLMAAFGVHPFYDTFAKREFAGPIEVQSSVDYLMLGIEMPYLDPRQHYTDDIWADRDAWVEQIELLMSDYAELADEAAL